MSIIKVVKKEDSGIERLQAILPYVERVSATRSEFIYGVGVSTNEAYRQMMLVKETYGQENGKAYFHYILNPDESDYSELNNKQLFNTGCKIAELLSNFYGNYQVIMALHFDTDSHLHFITNNIDYITGNRLDLSPHKLAELKMKISEILTLAGITPVLQYYFYENDE